MTIASYKSTKILGKGRILTPWFRAAFADVYQLGKTYKPTDEPKYGITPLFDESQVDIMPMKKAVYECAREKFGDKIKPSKTYELPPWCNSPFHDGAEKPDYEGYEGMTFFRASSKFQPQVIDRDRVTIGEMDEPGFYSGCYARATVGPWAYDHPQRKGVGFNIFNIQKLADGEPFGGSRVDAEDEFDDANDFDNSAIPQSYNSEDDPDWMK